MKYSLPVAVIFTLLGLTPAMIAAADENKSPATQPGTEGAGKAIDAPALALKYSRSVDLVALSADGKLLASEGNFTLRVTDVRTGEVVRAMHGNHANSMAFSPDGKFLAIGTSSGNVEILGLPTLVREHVLPVTQWSIYAIAISADSKQVAACGADGTVQVWDIAAEKKLLTLGSKGPRMAALAFTPDGKRLASLNRDGRCDVYDLVSGNLVNTAAAVGSDGGQLRFSADGTKLAILARGLSLYLWSPDAKEPPQKIAAPEALIGKPRVNGFGMKPGEQRPMDAPLGDFILGESRISADLLTMVSVLENGRIAWWDVATQKVLRILPTGHVEDLFGGGVHTLDFLGNGELFATGSDNGLAEVWRTGGDGPDAAKVIDADGVPGPWGEAVQGLRTRLIMEPVKIGETTKIEGAPIAGRVMPVSQGVWWRVSLQVRNETDKALKVVWPELRQTGGLIITNDKGEVVEYHSADTDQPVTRQIPISLQPHDIMTLSSILLGRNHDMASPGKYTIKFPETVAKAFPAGVTNPTLPASNILTLENENGKK